MKKITYSFPSFVPFGLHCVCSCVCHTTLARASAGPVASRLGAGVRESRLAAPRAGDGDGPVHAVKVILLDNTFSTFFSRI